MSALGFSVSGTGHLDGTIVYKPSYRPVTMSNDLRKESFGITCFTSDVVAKSIYTHLCLCSKLSVTEAEVLIKVCRALQLWKTVF